METSVLAAFLKDPKANAGAFVRRYHVASWFIVASTLLTGLVMRPSEVTVIILGLNVLLVGLAISWFRDGWTPVWMIVAAEILAATEMLPSRLSVIVLLANLALLFGALGAARIGASRDDA
ncbi:MAG: hypothetical protein N2444_01790 [Methylocystis sp.]|nr:hypothetical protein [Methylocystis sp.]